MIMKVFGITVNKRKPCTKKQTERGDETEKDVVWSNVEHCSVFDHLAGHGLSLDLSFVFQNCKTALSVGLSNTMLVCLCLRAIILLKNLV